VKASTPLGVLFLRRDALLETFHSRLALPVGALLVLSAALARNYDGEDLLAEPWWLAAPFGASLLTSFILWTCFAIWAKPVRFADYGRLLRIYWLTAPLAWFYGIPYERFLTPVQAVEANAWTLLVVSLWRVLIIARTLQVLYGISLIRTLTFTLAFGAITIFTATLLTPRPVLDIMGGMRLPPEDRALVGLTLATGFFSLIASVIFGLAALMAIPPRPDQPRTPVAPPTPPTATRPAALLAVAALAIAAWIPPLLVAQPEQQRRRAAENAFTRADYTAMLADLSRHQPRDYPPNWRLPGGHLPSRVRATRLTQLLPCLNAATTPWVRDGYTGMARECMLVSAPYTDVNDWVDWVVENPEYLESDRAFAPSQQILRWLIVNDPALTDEQRGKLAKLSLPEPPPPPAERPSPHP
jgi:hypothetical protein